MVGPDAGLRQLPFWCASHSIIPSNVAYMYCPPLCSQSQLASLETLKSEKEALKSEKHELTMSLAAKTRELESAQQLLSEYKSLSSQKDSSAHAAAAKLEADIKKLQVCTADSSKGDRHHYELWGQGCACTIFRYHW